VSVELLLQEFHRVTEAPDAVSRVRRFVLDLAVLGKLVESDAAVPSSKAPEVVLPWKVPETWTVVDLAGLAGPHGIFVDGDWVESKDQDPNGDIRLTQLADVGMGHFRNRSSRFMRRDVAERINCTYLQPGDVLIARMPDPIGRACLFPGDVRPCVTVVDVAMLRSARADVDRNYVVHALNSSQFSALVLAKAAGTTRQRISRGNLGKLPFPLPPLAEQHRIVAKVDELMTLCDQLEAAQDERETRRHALRVASLHRSTVADGDEADRSSDVRFFLQQSPRMLTKADHLAAVRRTILDLAMRGRLVPRERVVPDPDLTEPASSAVGPFPLPNTWTWRPVSYVGGGRLGKMLDKAKNRGTSRRYLRNVNVRWFDFDLSDVKTMPFEDDELAEFELRKGDVLICEGGEPGRAAVWDGREKDIYFQKAIHRVRLGELVLPHYFVLYLRASANSGDIVARSTGATFKHLTGQGLAVLPVPIPPVAEQQRIVATVGELMEVCDELERALAAAQTARVRLLEALLHGALDGSGAAFPAPA
jgi:type I restriction enzyme, S subunit